MFFCYISKFEVCFFAFKNHTFSLCLPYLSLCSHISQDVNNVMEGWSVIRILMPALQHHIIPITREWDYTQKSISTSGLLKGKNVISIRLHQKLEAPPVKKTSMFFSLKLGIARLELLSLKNGNSKYCLKNWEFSSFCFKKGKNLRIPIFVPKTIKHFGNSHFFFFTLNCDWKSVYFFVEFPIKMWLKILGFLWMESHQLGVYKRVEALRFVWIHQWFT